MSETTRFVPVVIVMPEADAALIREACSELVGQIPGDDYLKIRDLMEPNGWTWEMVAAGRMFSVLLHEQE